MTYLAVPIAAVDLEQGRGQFSLAKAQGAEMVELRLDYMEGLSVERAEAFISAAREICGVSVPLIVTCRDEREGGARDYPLGLRVDVLVAAIKAGAEYVDFEYANCGDTLSQERLQSALAARMKGRLIISAHDFSGRFEDIGGLYRRITSSFPGAIPKLVYHANHINDCFEAFDLLRRTSGERIVLCMGQAGLISRALAKKLGGFVTFGALGQDKATAPGQLTIGELKEIYRYDSINADTEIYGVVGSPVGHSKSPVVHNGCFEQAGADKVYLPLLVDGGAEQFEKFMENILSRRWLGVRGLSVTIPHKVNALEFIEAKGGYIEPVAGRIGAVNTLLIGGEGELEGYNTDCSGALDAIISGMGIRREELNGVETAVVGAGGAARAIVAGLRDCGANVAIYNRTVSKAKDLAGEFDCDFAGLDRLGDMRAKLLVNCTSVGMWPEVDETPVGRDCLKGDMTVFDTIYNPARTRLLREAEEAGAKTIDGLAMFVNQAVKQYELFVGADGDVAEARRVICDCLSEK